MNKAFYNLTIPFLCLLFCQCSNNELAENNKNGNTNTGKLVINTSNVLPDVEDKYTYPIVPGTDEWAALSSTDEVYRVSQLPDSVLHSISTFGLIRSILDIPALDGFYWASSNSSPVGTVYQILANYNNLAELYKRKDRADALLTYYEVVNIDNLTLQDVVEQRRVAVQLTTLEVLFTKPEILSLFDFEQKQQLVALLLSHYEQVKQLQISIPNETLTTTAWILYDAGYEPLVHYYGSDLKAEWFNVLDNQKEDIIAFANNFIHTSKK